MSQATSAKPVARDSVSLEALKNWLPLILSAVLVVLTFIAYIGTVRHKLTTWDDDKYISLNDYVQRGLTFEGVRWAFTTTYQENYHPLTWISLMVDASVDRPWVFKFTNMLFHSANGVLLFLAFWRMTSQIWPSFFVAGLFLLHPLHVESVAWATERKDVLSTFFMLLGLHSYVWYARRGSVVGYVLLLVCHLLSLLSKQTYVTLPFLLLLLDYWPLRRLVSGDSTNAGGAFRPTNWTGAVIEKLLPMSLSMLAAAGIYYIQALAPGVQRAEFSPVARIGNALVAYAAYLRKTVAPIDLYFFYPYPPGGHDLATIAVSAVVVILLTVGAFMLFRKLPFVFVGWLWFIVMLLPMSGIVQVGFQAYADRYTYFPLVGIFVILVWGGAMLANVRRQERPGIIGVAGVLLMACLGLSTWQVSTWSTTETMARHALDFNVNNSVALVQYGSTFAFKGEWEEAEKLYTKAIEIDPKNYAGLLSLATVSLGRADVEGAKEKFLRVLELDPTNETAQLELGIIAMGEGKLDDAIKRLRVSANSNPTNRQTLLALGIAYVRNKDTKKGRLLLNEVVRLTPEEGAGFRKEAERALELVDRIERVDPSGENRFRVLFHWPPTVSGARLMADQAVFLYGRKRIDYKEAIDRIDASLKIWPNNVDAIFNLGVIANENKRAEQASAAFSRVLELDRNNRQVRNMMEAAKAAATPTGPTVQSQGIE